jgi:CubicO group peptidase (beta-lactamase class C family)
MKILLTVSHQKNKPGKLLLFLIALFLQLSLFAQHTTSLPRSNPEAEGVSSKEIIQFLDAISESNHEFHSFMILRHGKVVAEGWWKPYEANLKHTMYSVSKSFTATAVGFAVAEKRISVNDKVISFFPADLPDTVSTYLSELRIKDLLSMSVGQTPDPTGDIGGKNDNWIKAFFNTPILYQPGSKFLYNSAATYMLSAIVQKVTGERILNYLQPRLFDPLGITGIDWEVSPQKINSGGWGLRLKTEDMAKFGQLFLQKGNWKGKQVLPRSWVEEASTMKIEQDPTATQARKDSSDWLQGYCYQMWRSRNNAYRADGAFGQFIIVLPEKDAVVVITSETTNMQGEFNLVWKYLLPAFKPGKIAADPTALSQLKKKTSSLTLPMVVSTASPTETKISGKPLKIVENENHSDNISFQFQNGVCKLTVNNDSAQYSLSFGSGKWVMGETRKLGPSLTARLRGNRSEISTYKIAGSYHWKTENTLELTLRYIESPHTETIRCVFDGSNVHVEFINSFNKAVSTTFKAALPVNIP